MSKKVEAAFIEKFGVGTGVLVAIRGSEDSGLVDSGQILEVTRDKEGQFTAQVVNYTANVLLTLVGYENIAKTLIKLAPEVSHAELRETVNAINGAFDAGYSRGEKLGGLNIVSVLPQPTIDNILLVLRNGKKGSFELRVVSLTEQEAPAAQDVKAEASIADGTAQDVDRVFKKVKRSLSKHGHKLGDVVLVDRGHVTEVGRGHGAVEGLFIIDSIGEKGVTLAQEPGTPLGIANATDGGIARLKSEGRIVHNVDPAALVKPNKAQKTSRGTEWDAVDVLEARYGLTIGDEVVDRRAEGDLGKKIDGVMFSTYPGSTVGDVLVVYGKVSGGKYEIAGFADPLDLTPINVDDRETRIALGAVVVHKLMGTGQVIAQFPDFKVNVQFLSGENADLHEDSLVVKNKQVVKFSELGLLQPFKVGEQSFVKVGGSTAIATRVTGWPDAPRAELAISASEVGKAAKRSFKQSDKVSLFSNA